MAFGGRHSCVDQSESGGNINTFKVLMRININIGHEEKHAHTLVIIDFNQKEET